MQRDDQQQTFGDEIDKHNIVSCMEEDETSAVTRLNDRIMTLKASLQNSSILNSAENDRITTLQASLQNDSIMHRAEEEERHPIAKMNDRLTALKTSVQDLGTNQIEIAEHFMTECVRMDKLQRSTHDRSQKAISIAKEQIMSEINLELGRIWESLGSLHMILPPPTIEQNQEDFNEKEAPRAASLSEDLESHGELNRIISELRKDIDVVCSNLKNHKSQTEMRILAIEMNSQHSDNTSEAPSGLKAFLQDLDHEELKRLMSEMRTDIDQMGSDLKLLKAETKMRFMNIEMESKLTGSSCNATEGSCESPSVRAMQNEPGQINSSLGSRMGSPIKRQLLHCASPRLSSPCESRRPWEQSRKASEGPSTHCSSKCGNLEQGSEVQQSGGSATAPCTAVPSGARRRPSGTRVTSSRNSGVHGSMNTASCEIPFAKVVNTATVRFATQPSPPKVSDQGVSFRHSLPAVWRQTSTPVSEQAPAWQRERNPISGWRKRSKDNRWERAHQGHGESETFV